MRTRPRSFAYRLSEHARNGRRAQEACVKAFARITNYAHTNQPPLRRLALCLYRMSRLGSGQRARAAGERSRRKIRTIARWRSRVLESADALARLDPQLRAAVLVVDQLGFDYETTGEILAIPQARLVLASTRHGAS